MGATSGQAGRAVDERAHTSQNVMGAQRHLSHCSFNAGCERNVGRVVFVTLIPFQLRYIDYSLYDQRNCPQTLACGTRTLRTHHSFAARVCVLV